MDDEALMRRVARGDAAAFGCLVDRYQRRLTAFAERITGDREAASDAVQDALIGVWRARTRYEPRGRLERYLLAAVRSACLDQLRTTRRTAVRALGAAREPGCPVGQADDRVLALAVRDAVLALPEAQRHVFVLSQYEGLTYAEIADMMGCRLGTVASRKRLAVGALRRSLAAWEEK